MGVVAGNGSESEKARSGHVPVRPAPSARQAPPERSAGLPRPLGGPRDMASGGEPDAIRIVEILSHELRSPITTIHLGTKVLAANHGDIPGAVRTEVVEAVEAEAERLYRLVEDLLAVARHEGGANPLPVAPILLQHWLVRIIEGEIRADRRLRIRAAIPSGLPPVLADEAALAHVVRNLLANAARYAADGQPVELVAHPPRDGYVVLDVLDHGSMFPPDEAERLFDAFYRAPEVAPLGSGAGLGLTAARRLMRAMSGDLDAVPRDGGGARFRVHLQVARPDEETDQELEAAG